LTTQNGSAHPPRAYAEWLPVLDRFANGDDDALHDLALGEAPWTSGVAQRWTSQVVFALETRLTALSDSLQRALRRAMSHDDQARALIAARRRLAALNTFAGLDCIPDEVQARLRAQIESWQTNTQNALEKSARSVRDDDGRMLKVLKENALVRATAGSTTPIPDPSRNGGRGRRILL